jgi:general secretion pathway protein L
MTKSWIKLLFDGAALSAQFLSWWFQELGSFIPARWRQADRLRLEARQEAHGFHLVLIRPPTIIDEARIQDGGREVGKLYSQFSQDHRSLPLWLIPAETSILSRTIQIPSAAAARFGALLGLDIDRWSPFKIDEVYVAWELSGTGSGPQRDVELRMVPHRTIAALRTDLATVGLAASHLVLGASPAFRIDLRSLPDRLLHAGTASTFAALLLLVVAVIADWVSVKHEIRVWRERYRSEFSLFTTQRGIEERISRAVMTMEQSTSTKSRGRILAELSSAIPETDWLTEISIKAESLTLQGYSANIDRLIKALEPLTADHNVSLQGEAAADNALNRQRFTIAFRPAGA